MMISRKNLAAKAYLDLVAMIASLPAKGMISETEEIVLLDILDMVIKQDDVELWQALAGFLENASTSETSEIDEIVKATLLSGQLKDNTARSMVINLINNLSTEKKGILERG